MRRLFIEIPEPAFETLAELARRDRRPVRDQAGWLLERYIRQEGESPAAGSLEDEHQLVGAPA